MMINIRQVVIDDTIYPRNKVILFNINRMTDAFDAGARFPPLVIEEGTKRLVDGRHRYEMFKGKGVKKVEVIAKVYSSDADLFADAVRLNIGHGQNFDQITTRTAIIRLGEYGYSRAQIAEIVRVPAVSLEGIERGFALSEDGKPLALKSGLSHMRGQVLTQEQVAVNRQYGGPKAVFFVKQICSMLEHGMWPDRSQPFVAAMDRLVLLWGEIRTREGGKDDAA
jgi:hypothetical protein